MVFETRTNFEAQPKSVRDARHFVGRALRGRANSEAIDDAMLLASEIVTNAVLHADSSVEVVITLPDDTRGLRIEVKDKSPEQPQVRDTAVTDVNGRGLHLVEELAVDWGVRPDPPGKAVWFELDRSRSLWPHDEYDTTV